MRPSRKRRNAMAPVGEVLVRYSAEEMPAEAIQTIQRETVDDYNAGQLSPKDALRITNLLLTIALQKLDTA
jgi:hypothetical protein